MKADTRISLTTIAVQGDEQDAFEVYATPEREQTLGFIFDEADAELFLKAKDGAVAPQTDALGILERLAEKVERVNSIRHSGGRLRAGDWSELHSLTNEAKAVVTRAGAQAQPLNDAHMRVRAECHSDDRNIQVEFDAATWLAEAPDKYIINLAQCGWRNDYPADDVAIAEADRNEKVAFMFKYIETIRDDPSKKDQCGFECGVNRSDAIAWLKANRPALAKRIEKVEAGNA